MVKSIEIKNGWMKVFPQEGNPVLRELSGYIGYRAGDDYSITEEQYGIKINGMWMYFETKEEVLSAFEKIESAVMGGGV